MLLISGVGKSLEFQLQGPMLPTLLPRNGITFSEEIDHRHETERKENLKTGCFVDHKHSTPLSDDSLAIKTRDVGGRTFKLSAHIIRSRCA